MGSLNHVKELLREKDFIVKLTAQKMKFKSAGNCEFGHIY